MFFDFFKPKKATQETNADVLASITYSIYKDSNVPSVDIELNDYNDESASALCKLLNLLSHESFYIDTVNMIKESMLSDGQEELLIYILTNISDGIRQKLLNNHGYETKDEVCIKPSDILR